MQWNLSSQERRAVYADLKAEYLYVIIPFWLLIAVKVYTADWTEIVLSTDWSLISCIVFGQITFKMSKAVARSKVTNDQQFGYYAAKRFLLIIVAAAFYFGMVHKPTMLLGCMQIMLFMFASVLHFKDGVAVYAIQKQ